MTDTLSFEEFARRHTPALLRSAFLLTGGASDAEDLVQESLARAYGSWRRIGRMEHPVAYVTRILVNRGLTLARRRGRDLERAVRYEADAAPPDPTSPIEDRQLLVAALRQLPPRQRAAVVLRFYEGLTERETAEAMNCSLGNVKSQTNRALVKLRLLLPADLFRPPPPTQTQHDADPQRTGVTP